MRCNRNVRCDYHKSINNNISSYVQYIHKNVIALMILSTTKNSYPDVEIFLLKYKLLCNEAKSFSLHIYNALGLVYKHKGTYKPFYFLKGVVAQYIAVRSLKEIDFILLHKNHYQI